MKRTDIFEKERFKYFIREAVRSLFRRELEEASIHQIYQAVCAVAKEAIVSDWMDTQKRIKENDSKIVYYMSMEFLTGRYLGNNLMNMGSYGQVAEALEELGIDISDIEEEERDPALGNGGLGRLAACFLDSLASLGYPAYGCGIRYHYGMFRQRIRDGYQIEVPDNWLVDGGYPFELKRPEYAKEIRFGGHVDIGWDEEEHKNTFSHKDYSSVRAVPYDLPVVGYGNGVVNTLRIWDAEAINEFMLDDFDKGNYHKAVEQENLAKNITEVLYPNDNHTAGKELRLKQQYFFVSATMQTAVQRFKKDHDDIRKLPEKAVFQMNDTHPTVAVPELMRILLDEEGLEWDEAWEVTQKSCAYTNHTIMSEALEKWPISLFQRLLPRIYQIIAEIDRRFVGEIREKYPRREDKVAKMAILYDGQVRMANMAIVGGFSVNGVARLHTEILEKRELADFYELMPEKFSNKTNGITQRRFLLHGNPMLAKWVTDHIGDGWITDLSQMRKLLPLTENKTAAEEFMRIKRANKVRLAEYIKKHNGIDVDPDSIFDVQVKRLHEYKRQLLNILHVIGIYLKLKNDPGFDPYPRTFIFGAKASAGYERAKSIIKLINSVADVVNNDESIGGRIKVVFIEDYRVSNAELIFSASDVSEQISTASKEASGTGNMKFMLNGAVTLGTLDGANVEIVEEVGEENAVIFGLKAEEVMAYEKNGNYDPRSIAVADKELSAVLRTLTDGTFSDGDRNLFRGIYESLLYGDRPDTYFIIADYKAYVQAQEKIEAMYRDREGWARSALANTACSGKFSSDRTIEDYARDIWKIEKLKQPVSCHRD